MRKIHVWRWAASALSVALLLGSGLPVCAVVLGPSQSAPLFGAGGLGGLVVQDNLIHFQILDAAGNFCYEGVVQDRVVLTSGGTYDFYFRIRDTTPGLPCCIVEVARTDFTNQFTNVDWRIDGLGTIGAWAACRSAAGDEIDCFFDPCIRAGSDSRFHFVSTEATDYDPNGGTLTIFTDDGSSVTLTVAGPL
jgi:hypothetical protein